MQSIQSSSIDLVLTDPPYGIASKDKITKVGNKFVSTQKAWGNAFNDSWNTPEEYYLWLKPFISEMVRCLKDTGSIILFLDRKPSGLIEKIEKDFGLIYKNKFVFVKTNPLPSTPKRNCRSGFEEAVWFTKSTDYTFNCDNQDEMTQIFSGGIGGKNKDRFHPCHKYKWMIEPLVKRHSNEGDTILDPFAGGANILKAAKKMGRKSIGFEKNEGFFLKADAQLFPDKYITPVVQSRKNELINEYLNLKKEEITMSNQINETTTTESNAEYIQRRKNELINQYLTPKLKKNNIKKQEEKPMVDKSKKNIEARKNELIDQYLTPKLKKARKVEQVVEQEEDLDYKNKMAIHDRKNEIIAEVLGKHLYKEAVKDIDILDEETRNLIEEEKEAILDEVLHRSSVNLVEGILEALLKVNPHIKMTRINHPKELNVA